MFKVLTGEKKRRAFSPATITASIAAHLLLLGGLVYASTGGPEQVKPVETDSIPGYIELEPKAPPPPAVQQPTPPPPPDEPVKAPVPGPQVLPPVEKVPDTIAPEAPGTQPLTEADVSPEGNPGNVPGPPTGEPNEPTGPAPTGPGTDYIPDESMVEVRPALDRNGLGRALERNYPPVLRDARVSGRVVIELIVDENGRPRPGSARVIEASHPAFGDAALRAVDRFRFRPARMGGTAVPVRVTIPIQWTVPN